MHDQCPCPLAWATIRPLERRVVQGLHQRLRKINSAHVEPGLLESLIAKPRSLAYSRRRSQRPNDDQRRARSCIRRGLWRRDRAGFEKDLPPQSIGQSLPNQAMKDLPQRVQPGPSRHGLRSLTWQSDLAERRSVPARWRAVNGPRKGHTNTNDSDSQFCPSAPPGLVGYHQRMSIVTSNSMPCGQIVPFDHSSLFWRSRPGIRRPGRRSRSR
jgi:hypothetical protein